MKVFTLFLILALLVNIIRTSEEIVNCATPCIPTNDCYYSICDTTQGVCVQQLKENLPADCCESSSDCKTGECIFTSCNLGVNQCEYIAICSNPGLNITKKACINDNQCQGDNPCSLSKCIDGFCRSSPLTNPNNDLCCLAATDCLSYPCTETFCDVETFTCFYEPILGCEISFGDSVIQPDESTSTSSSSSSLSSRAELYEIPDNPDAGDIFFLIVGCIILLGVIIFFIWFVIKSIYDHFFGDKPLAHDIEEAAAAGHTGEGGHGGH